MLTTASQAMISTARIDSDTKPSTANPVPSRSTAPTDIETVVVTSGEVCAARLTERPIRLAAVLAPRAIIAAIDPDRRRSEVTAEVRRRADRDEHGTDEADCPTAAHRADGPTRAATSSGVSDSSKAGRRHGLCFDGDEHGALVDGVEHNAEQRRACAALGR